MALSVSPNGGNGLANLFRQARPEKLADKPAPTEAAATAVSLRPLGRSGIDSTGSGAAQISAALTVYLSKLGGADDGVSASGSTGVVPAVAAGSASRSGAADLMRVLDAYGSGKQRLRA